MPRCILWTCCALLIGLGIALPSYGLFPRPEPDEWPTLQFSVPDPKRDSSRSAIYVLGNGEVIDTSKKVFREKPLLSTLLYSPLQVDIRGYTPANIEQWPITPETETVLLIDEIYNPDLPYGGIAGQSHIIREKPRGGWAQRFLHLKKTERFWEKMNNGTMTDEGRAIHNSEMATKFPTVLLTLEPYKFTLSPGKHTIQVLMLDTAGKPINPPITSKYATVIVLPPDLNYWPIILWLAGITMLAVLAVAIIKYHRGRPLGGRP